MPLIRTSTASSSAGRPPPSGPQTIPPTYFSYQPNPGDYKHENLAPTTRRQTQHKLLVPPNTHGLHRRRSRRRPALHRPPLHRHLLARLAQGRQRREHPRTPLLTRRINHHRSRRRLLHHHRRTHPRRQPARTTHPPQLHARPHKPDNPGRLRRNLHLLPHRPLRRRTFHPSR